MLPPFCSSPLVVYFLLLHIAVAVGKAAAVPATAAQPTSLESPCREPCLNGTTPGPASIRYCSFAFDVLLAYLTGLGDYPVPDFEDTTSPGLFVTWTSTAGAGQGQPDQPGQLRGCLGTTEPVQLHTALPEYALLSALRDLRFPPVQLQEVPHLSCSVSILHSFEPADSWQDWQVGRHGLDISFSDPVQQDHTRTATYLPDVAAEVAAEAAAAAAAADEAGAKRHCVESLVDKAGYAGPPTDELLDSLAVTRYQSSTATLSYEEYSRRGLARVQLPPKGGSSGVRWH